MPSPIATVGLQGCVDVGRLFAVLPDRRSARSPIVGFAAWLYSNEPIWWVAGAAGGVMSVFWNYSMSSLFVWRTR